MEIREFAERVLFADTLDGKLTGPGPEPPTDDRPGPPVAAPAAPGRPASLRFKPAGSGKSGFPGTHALDRTDERGRLLHFFANHELLATELMALVLLRFPEAPTAFRRGVFQTLLDEQEHTRLYIDRIRACGLDFGDLPVSGYFWRAVSGMESPIDYVAGLSLTFEQANLDYARHYAACFATVGDAEASRLLERIYRDEIGHVAYGLKWFRRWKNPSESDWEAFCRHLRFPLSPQRAKGTSVNVEGRRAAGLDPEFIAELEVYSRSRGRTPTVHVFNPFAEAILDHGPAFAPNLRQAALARDLATLPQFLARPDDVVLVERRPRTAHLAALRRAGLPLPEFALVDPTTRDVPTLVGRKIGGLRPWAWAPDSLQRFVPLLPLLTGAPPPRWTASRETLARLYSKPWSAEMLRRFLAQTDRPGPWPAWLCPPEIVGRPARTPAEVLEEIARLRAQGHPRLVVKQALGLAGAGAIRLWEPTLTPAQHRWIESATDQNRVVVVEPWLDRLVDFSIQLEHGADGLRLVGYSGLHNDHRGQFLANWAEPDHAHRPPATVLATLAQTESDSSAASAPVGPAFHALVRDLIAFLAPELRAAGHAGPLGIDAFVYRDVDGRHRLKPVVEINPRVTMGRLTLELMAHLCPGTCARFEIVGAPRLQREGCRSFTDFAEALAARHPLRLEGAPVARIRSGAVPLTDPAGAEAYLAVLTAARTTSECAL